MATSYGVVDTHFNPLSMEELLKMPTLETAKQDEIESKYSELQQQAADLESLANSAQDKETYNKYKTYANDVQKQLNQVMEQGFNPNSKRSLYDLSNRYKSEIDPIKAKMTEREELIKEQRKLSAANNKLLFDNDYSKMSLSDMMKNPVNTYNSLDGTSLYTEGKNQAAAFSDRLFSFEQRRAMGNQYFELTKKQGLNPTQALAFMSNDQSNPVLAKLASDLMSQYQLDSFGQEGQDKAKQFLISGMMEGLTYKEDKSYQANRNFESDADRANRESLIASRAAATKASEMKSEYGDYIGGGKYWKGLTGGAVLITDTNNGIKQNTHVNASAAEVALGNRRSMDASKLSPAENKIINARRAARDAFKPQYAVENTQKGTAAGETIFAGNKGASADHDMTFFGKGNSPFRSRWGTMLKLEDIDKSKIEKINHADMNERGKLNFARTLAGDQDASLDTELIKQYTIYRAKDTFWSESGNEFLFVRKGEDPLKTPEQNIADVQALADEGIIVGNVYAPYDMPLDGYDSSYSNPVVREGTSGALLEWDSVNNVWVDAITGEEASAEEVGEE